MEGVAGGLERRPAPETRGPQPPIAALAATPRAPSLPAGAAQQLLQPVERGAAVGPGPAIGRLHGGRGTRLVPGADPRLPVLQHRPVFAGKESGRPAIRAPAARVPALRSAGRLGAGQRRCNAPESPRAGPMGGAGGHARCGAGPGRRWWLAVRGKRPPEGIKAGTERDPDFREQAFWGPAAELSPRENHQL